MKLSTKIKLSLTILMMSLSGASAAFAGEWEDTMEIIDDCYLEYDEAYKSLPDINIATSEEVITAYDKTPKPENCALALLEVYSIFEEAGYFSIIEYRDDLHERRKIWVKTEAKLDSWREHAAINHKGLREELQKRKEIKLQNTPKRSRSQILNANNKVYRECRKKIYKQNPHATDVDKLALVCAEANPRYTPDTRKYKCYGVCD